MKVRVRIAEAAEPELAELDAWWRTNRASAAVQVADEIERLQQLLASQPEIGRRYRRGGVKHVRWLRLQGTPYKAYYRYEPGSGEASIIALWSGARRGEPPLGGR